MLPLHKKGKIGTEMQGQENILKKKYILKQELVKEVTALLIIIRKIISNLRGLISACINNGFRDIYSA